MAVSQRSRSQRSAAADDVTPRDAAVASKPAAKTKRPAAKKAATITKETLASKPAAQAKSAVGVKNARLAPARKAPRVSEPSADRPQADTSSDGEAKAANASVFTAPFDQFVKAFSAFKVPGLMPLDLQGLPEKASEALNQWVGRSGENLSPVLDKLKPMQQALGSMGQSLGSTLTSIAGLSVQPDALKEIQQAYMQQATELWNSSLEKPEQVKVGDRRFDAPEWGSNPVNTFMASLYLLNARTLQKLADNLQGDTKARQRVRFAVQQWADAASPSNFLAFNPEALKKAVDTKGQSLQQGLQHLMNDLRQGHMSQTDESVFEVGKNVATTAGTVVFENPYFQLIEYAPLTPQVHEVPFIFVPPCINKYYILDLQPDNSVVRHLLSQGHRVFMISWVNPDESLAKSTWDDYVEHGVMKAIDVTLDVSGSDKANMLGFCVGGTLLASTLATLAAQGRKPAASLTLLTSFLDFSETGVLDIFVDEAMVRMREMTMGPNSPQGGGLMKGADLATTFSFLRPNDLVWNYVVGNYLKGEMPPAFDLLYWNSDSTNLPGPFYTWYLRNTYLENKMREPNAVEVCGVPLDLRRLDMPTFIYGSREDHIVPWDGAYESTKIVQGPKTFVLGASGHIAGVINPPEKKKRSYWTSGALARGLPATSKEWMATAQENPGSWWPVWADWLGQHAGTKVPAPKQPGNKRYQPIEAAPGRYVLRKA
jgi:polyhydroxyalkanoate synthase